jgi:preprotein translocase subunit YajC
MLQLTWVILITLMVIMVIRIIYKLIKSERLRKEFITTMKPGDKVYVPVVDNKFYGEIIEVNDDEVIIKVKSPKRIVYPNKNNNE